MVIPAILNLSFFIIFYHPSLYLTHLLSHESAGSLLSALKRRGFATELLLDTYRPGLGFACIILYANLTDLGLGRFLSLTFQF